MMAARMQAHTRGEQNKTCGTFLKDVFFDNDRAVLKKNSQGPRLLYDPRMADIDKDGDGTITRFELSFSRSRLDVH